MLLNVSFILALSVALISCNPLVNKTLSNSMMVITSMTGHDIDGNTTNFLQSDVLTSLNTVTADQGLVSIRAQMLSPDPISGSSQYNSIMVTHYVVSYFRSDGKNTEGVDIP